MHPDSQDPLDRKETADHQDHQAFLVQMGSKVVQAILDLKVQQEHPDFQEDLGFNQVCVQIIHNSRVNEQDVDLNLMFLF